MGSRELGLQTRFLSGNEALALGAHDAGVRVAAAYPGTPSTEIVESLAAFADVGPATLMAGPRLGLAFRVGIGLGDRA